MTLQNHSESNLSPLTPHPLQLRDKILNTKGSYTVANYVEDFGYNNKDGYAKARFIRYAETLSKHGKLPGELCKDPVLVRMEAPEFEEEFLTALQADLQVYDNLNSPFQYSCFGLREGYETSTDFPSSYEFSSEGMLAFRQGILHLESLGLVSGKFKMHEYSNRADELKYHIDSINYHLDVDTVLEEDSHTEHLYSIRQYGIIKALQTLHKKHDGKFKVKHDDIHEIAKEYLEAEGYLGDGLVVGQPTTRLLRLLESYNHIRRSSSSKPSRYRTFNSLLAIDVEEGILMNIKGMKFDDVGYSKVKLRRRYNPKKLSDHPTIREEIDVTTDPGTEPEDPQSLQTTILKKKEEVMQEMQKAVVSNDVKELERLSQTVKQLMEWSKDLERIQIQVDGMNQ